MKSFKEYEQYDGLGLAELVRRQEVSPEELCEAAIERIEAINPEINAVITPMFDKARAAAKIMKPEGLFAGVPFLLKDLMAAYAGVPLNNGCKGLRNYIPDYDSELVKRFKSAGVNILGKTNTPEFGLVAYTEPELHGPTRNPWHTDHTPGGSSGGSAAAVASGMVPMAHASDGGGSIRVPASECGLVGLKPSRGRISQGPKVGEGWAGATTDGVVSLSVRDTATMLDVIAGRRTGDPYTAAPPTRPFADEVGVVFR